jgi:hypothetical protein
MGVKVKIGLAMRLRWVVIGRWGREGVVEDEVDGRPKPKRVWFCVEKACA